MEPRHELSLIERIMADKLQVKALVQNLILSLTIALANIAGNILFETGQTVGQPE